MSQVLLKKVVKRYGDAKVIHDIDLTIRDSEFIVLVGPSSRTRKAGSWSKAPTGWANANRRKRGSSTWRT